jgi:processive 1,2-diacylglycerol beta-glucosyltransferase
MVEPDQAECLRRPARVLVLTGDMGEGHNAAARAIAAELARQDPDIDVVVKDGLGEMGPTIHRLFRDGYRLQLERFPSSYSLFYSFFLGIPRARRIAQTALSLLASRRLLRLIDSQEPDVVVSTYPLITTVLGRLRERGRVVGPAYATVTELAGVELWAARGIDLHFVMHEHCVEGVERVAGKGSAAVVRLLVDPIFLEPLSGDEARQKLHLPPDEPLVLVSGGGWGMGDLSGAVEVALTIPDTLVICVTGNNRALRKQLERRYQSEPRVRTLAFTEKMNELLAAADVLVHSTAGVTCFEAWARGCPLIAWGAPPGHARLAADAMASLGLASAPRTRRELNADLRRVLRRPGRAGGAPTTAPSAAALIAAPYCPAAFLGYDGRRSRKARRAATRPRPTRSEPGAHDRPPGLS